MSWTYSGDPASSPKDTVRFLIGDTDPARKLVSDEEILFALAESGGDPVLASKRVLGVLLIRFSMMGEVEIGDYRFDARDIAKLLQGIKDGLDAVAAIQTGVWYAGGISKDDKWFVKSDSDRVPPRFHRGMQRNQATREDYFD
jgi:hypothetical protein